MKIESLKLSDDEIRQATEMFLKSIGINMPVKSVEKKHSWEDDFVVELDLEIKKPTPVVPPEPTLTDTLLEIAKVDEKNETGEPL